MRPKINSKPKKEFTYMPYLKIGGKNVLVDGHSCFDSLHAGYFYAFVIFF